jgi:hypothetical protein
VTQPPPYSPKPVDNTSPMRLFMWGGVLMAAVGTIGAAYILGVVNGYPLGGFIVLMGGGALGAFWAKEQDQQDRASHLFDQTRPTAPGQFSDMSQTTPTRSKFQ